MTRAILLWGTWGALTVAGLVFVAWYGRNCPLLDEWAFLDTYAGQADLLNWLWDTHSEHRYPVGRLIYLGLFRLTGDLRPGMVLNLLCLSGSAALLLVTARRARGACSLADLFFPLAFLQPGHWDNVLMSYQLCFTLPLAAAAGLAYLTIARIGAWDWRCSAAAGLIVAILPGFGMGGVVLAAGAGMPLAGLAFLLLRRGQVASGLVLAVGLAVAAAADGCVLACYKGLSTPPVPRTADALYYFCSRVTAMGFGPAAEWLWRAGTGAVVVVAVAGGLGVCRALRSGEATAAVAALTVPVGALLILAALTWGRGWTRVEGAMVCRYSALALPMLFGAYLLAVRFGGRWLRVAGPASFAAIIAVAWPTDARVGLTHANRVAWQMDALAVDLAAGLPPDLIGERYDRQVLLAHPGMSSDFDTAARLGFTPFRHYEPAQAPCMHKVPLVPPPAGGVAAGWEVPAGAAVRLTGAFVPRRDIYGDVRVRVTTEGGDREELFWIAKNTLRYLVVRLDGKPARIEIDSGPGDSAYRVTAVDLFTPD